MSLKETIETDLKTAMKNRETGKVEVLRMLKARTQEALVALRGKEGADAVLGDEAVIEVVSRHAKQVRESLEGAEQAGRPELVDKAKGELALIEAYLPTQLSDDEITEIVRAAIAEAGASSLREMGAVMKIVMPKVKGKADGKKINETVKRLLESG
jgi:uncharacterized protein YqeY